MDMDHFEVSSAHGVHRALTRLVGTWEGVTKTWFEPDKLADESETRGTVRSILGGRFLFYEYRGTLLGEAMVGMAFVGYNLSDERYEMAWVDTCHMGTGIMFSRGGRRDGVDVHVTGGYGDPSSGERWGWRTEMALEEGDRLIIRMHNIDPEGREAVAVETVYRRR